MTISLFFSYLHDNFHVACLRAGEHTLEVHVLDLVKGYHEEREVSDVDQRVCRRLDEHHLRNKVD